MNRINKHLIRFLSRVLPMLPLLHACDPDTLGQRPQTGALPPGQESYVSLPLSIAVDGGGDTKATYLAEVETRGSGALVLCYRSSTGTFESATFFTQEQLEQAAADPADHPLWVNRIPVDRCDFYVLGNLHLVDKTSGTPVELPEGLGEAFPGTRSELESYIYHLDGRDVAGNLRTERMSEVRNYGIPYAKAAWNVNVAQASQEGTGIPGFTQCRRLFAKVNVIIDHSAFDENGAAVDRFVNQRLLVRYANTRFQPFRYSDSGTVNPDPWPQRAESADDIYSGENWADYDVEMSSDNAHRSSYTLYVPENMQGTLLGGNTDPARKVRDASLGDRQELVTSVQLDASLSVPVAGLGGQVSYQFCLGSDNTSNFDVVGGKEYTVSLSFNQGSILSPYWKVSFAKDSDSRRLRVRKFSDSGEDLGATPVAVRRSRPGTVYLFGHPTGDSGTNCINHFNEAFTPSSLTDYGAGVVTNALGDLGISASFDTATKALVFSVTDTDRYYAMIGQSRQITLRLEPYIEGSVQPGQQTITVTAVADYSASWSSSDTFYPAQYRTLSVSGFHGNVSHSSINPCWNGGNGSGTSTTIASTWSTWGDNYIRFTSDDAFNDGSYDVPVSIVAPMLTHATLGGSNGNTVSVPVDGNEVYIAAGFYPPGTTSFDESTRLKRGSTFDADLYDSVFGSIYLTGDYGGYFRVDNAGNVFMVSTTGSQGNAEDWSYTSDGKFGRPKNQYRIADSQSLLRITGSGFGMYTSNSSYLAIYVSKLNMDGFKKIYHYNAAFEPVNGSSADSDGYFNSSYFSDLGTWERTPGYTFNGNRQLYDITRSNGHKSGFMLDYSFYFQNGDFSSIQWSLSGECNTYITNSQKEVRAKIRHTVITPDSGSGGVGYWEFREEDQDTWVDGEPVPGGLCVPWDLQTVTATVKNKHDLRSFVCDIKTFKIRYSGMSLGVLVVARSGSTLASVCPMPQKAIYYLMKMAQSSSVRKSQRDRVVNMFEGVFRTGWDFSDSGLYRRHSYTGNYQLTGLSNVTFPRADYMISSFSALVSPSASFSAWNTTAMNYINHFAGFSTGQYKALDTNENPMYCFYVFGSSGVNAQGKVNMYTGDATLGSLACQGLIWSGAEDFWTTY